MTTKAHKNMTGVDLHEPKGIASATASQVYRADGAGSGSWQTITIPSGLFTTHLTSFTSTGTWTKPANIFKARVHVVAEGGNDSLSPGNGSTSSFGAFVSATGGQGSAGTAGTGSSGDINLTGAVGILSGIGENQDGGAGGGPWSPKGKGRSSLGGSSGSGGGYAVKEIAAASLTSTVAVTIGATAAANGFVVIEEFISV